MSAKILILLPLFGLLLYAAWGDLRTRTIPNALNAAIALGAPLWWYANALPLWPDIALQIGVAFVVFAIFAGFFALGAMGGGDVKMLAALALWLRAPALLDMLFVMAVIGGGVTIATMIVHKLQRREGRPEIPYGVAISCAALWIFANELLTTSAA
jgi:prepilin peptidase CpaA